MTFMYTKEKIVAAARQKGHTEEEIQIILSKIEDLKQRGLVKTSGRGANVGLTRAGQRKVAELKALGKIPVR